MKDPIKWLLNHDAQQMGYKGYWDAPPIIQSRLTEGAGIVIGAFIAIGGCSIITFSYVLLRFLRR